LSKTSGPIARTTQAEQIILEFLYEHKGVEFTAIEIEKETGIRADLVDHIMDNLRWKGFEVATERHRGVHYFVNNTWKSWLAGGLVFGSIIVMALYSFLMSIQ
jgi:hypothetical protein